LSKAIVLKAERRFNSIEFQGVMGNQKGIGSKIPTDLIQFGLG